ncbi:MAG TPA: TIGR02569 family protein [Jatrophihabitans sp.]|jgi:uncharacterized protein (TIGR02569 family)
MDVVGPPDRALTAFGLEGAELAPLVGGQGRSWRAGDVALKEVDAGGADAAQYVAELCAALPNSDDVRVPRPVATASGEWVCDGWVAWTWLPGTIATGRWPEIVAAGAALHRLFADVPRPGFLDDRNDVWSVGDRVAWGELPLVIDNQSLRALGHMLARHLLPCAEPDQLVHGDLTGNVLLCEGRPPAVIDISCYWRPASWASAVVVADALAWHGAGREVVTLVPGSQQAAMVARATLYRLITSDRHAATLDAAQRQPYLARSAAAYARVLRELDALDTGRTEVAGSSRPQ